ncbi:twin-arginine translocation signal domain-containing protein [Arthrobacter sp. VKM Ac-2550]
MFTRRDFVRATCTACCVFAMP